MCAKAGFCVFCTPEMKHYYIVKERLGRFVGLLKKREGKAPLKDGDG